MKAETRQDLNEIWRMSLMILFYIILYIIGKALVGLYANHNTYDLQDFIPSVENSTESIYAHINTQGENNGL